MLRSAALCLLLVLGACPGEDRSADGGLADGGPVEVTRTLVDDLAGYCVTTGDVDQSCTTVDDCVGYPVPVEVGCCSEDPVANVAACGFARRTGFPALAECTADARCRNVKRACVAGVCVRDDVNDACAEDSDCVLRDTGCECYARHRDVAGDVARYGGVCPRVALCADRRASCVAGRCLVVGSFMDDAIDGVCECDPGDHQACVDRYTAGDYARAADDWPWIEAEALRADGGTADGGGCLELVRGPWREAGKCVGVLCP